ncbi:MAG: nuclease A inhibitor family protein [Spirosomataceae bacterium]
MNEEEIQEKLITLTENLWFPSESDEPFAVEIKKGLTGSAIEKIAYLSSNSENFRLLDWELFWQPLVTPEDWHGSDEEGVRLRFVELKTFFEGVTSDYFVAKSGKIEVDVWIVGTWEQTDTLILKTLSIES